MDELTPELKARIDAIPLYDLFRTHRFAEPGDPRFQGAEGEYRCKRLAELRDKDPAAYVLASKTIGW
jgi:hypothetical protein